MPIPTPTPTPTPIFVEKRLGMEWDVESDAKSWYRVEGECIKPSCETGNLEPNDTLCQSSGSKYVQIIPARSLEDLCRLLSSTQPPFYVPALKNWRIKSVKKYNLTERLSDMGGVVPNCTILTEESFQSVPNCAPFLLATGVSPQVIGGAYTVLLLNKNYYYRSLGRFMISGNSGESTGLSMFGTVRTLSDPPTFIHNSSGNFLISGSSSVEVTAGTTYFEGTIVTCGGGYTRLLHLGGEHISYDPNPTGLTIDQSSVMNVYDCGTRYWPLKISLKHNFYNASVFKQFSLRNTIDFSEPIDMLYTSTSDQWQSIIHMTGISLTDDGQEIWTWVLQFQNTDQLEGQQLGKLFWKLSIQITRKIVALGQIQNSKVVLAVPLGIVCSENQLNAIFELNTHTGFATAGVEKTVADYTIVYDEIGLFGSTWQSSPILTLRISDSQVKTTTAGSVIINTIFPTS